DGIRDKLVTGVQTCALPIFGMEEFISGSKKLKTNGDYNDKILDKIYRTDPEKRSEVQVAFTIVLVHYVLNPKKEHIKIKEEILRSEERRVGKECKTRWEQE